MLNAKQHTPLSVRQQAAVVRPSPFDGNPWRELPYLTGLD